MKVIKEASPETDGIKYALKTLDFTDTFSTTNHKDSLKAITHLIFGTAPKWVSALMRFRNVLVKKIGLKTEMAKSFNKNFNPGDTIGFFKIFSIADDEVILGADDKHLDFRVSVYNSKALKNNIKVTTLVAYNNSFGKIYMGIIKPFHVLVVKRMVKQAYRL
ncbi:DUF2867 domain-containing protein [Flavobacteriaceae bacterium MHTCC 0001]